jgi:hypothetical protein
MSGALYIFTSDKVTYVDVPLLSFIKAISSWGLGLRDIIEFRNTEIALGQVSESGRVETSRFEQYDNHRECRAGQKAPRPFSSDPLEVALAMK